LGLTLVNDHLNFKKNPKTRSSSLNVKAINYISRVLSYSPNLVTLKGTDFVFLGPENEAFF